MNIQKMLDTYLTADKKHFRRRENIPIQLNDFYKVLGFYTKMNSDERLKLANVQTGTKSHMSWIYIKNGSKIYSVNGDTKLSGLKEFYSNRNNPCKTIYNRDGKLNLITNNINGERIEHLYMYRVED